MQKLPSCSDYSTSIMVSSLVKAPQLAGGAPQLHKGKPEKYAGGYCIVFPYIVNNRKLAVRCWHAFLEGAEERSRIIASALHKSQLPYFTSFEYVEDGIVTPLGIQPVVIMDWVEAQPLKSYIEEHLLHTNTLLKLAERFLKMTEDLHANSFSHGDLQHGNVLVKPNGEIVLVDYDSMYVPELSGWSDEISGLSGYQHPARWDNKQLSPKADYFSEMVIYTSLIALAELPQLWIDLKIKDTDTLLFSSEDIKSCGKSPIFDVLYSLDDCKGLIEQMRDALKCTSIDQITPLSVNRVSVSEMLSSLWNDNGYKIPPAYSSEDIEKITSKW